jgi:hypothetical protein
MAEVRSRRARRAHRRRLLGIVGAVVALLVALVVAVVLVSGGSGDSNQATSDHRATTSTQPTTTSTAAPGSTTATAPAASVPATPVPKSSNPVVALAQQYDGVYSGRFQNRSANTLGDAELTLRVDPATSKMSVAVAFSGDLFGSGSTAPRTLNATIDLGNPNAATTTPTDAFGPVTGKLEGTSVVLDAPQVPGGAANTFRLRGNLVGKGFDATYTAGFPDGHSTDGTVSVRCAATGQRPSQVDTVCSLPG